MYYANINNIYFSYYRYDPIDMELNTPYIKGTPPEPKIQEYKALKSRLESTTNKNERCIISAEMDNIRNSYIEGSFNEH